MQLRRRFEETISRSRGRQLLWLSGIIILFLLVFWFISAVIFGDRELSKQLLGLFISSNCFNLGVQHEWLKFFVSLCGILLFSALLISVLTNIIGNIGDSYRNGTSRYRHNGHTLILGSGRLVDGILSSLCTSSDSSAKDIVILTEQPAAALRNRLFSSFDGEALESLKKRLTIYYGERDNAGCLKRKELVLNASDIYIIGEDEEKGHDSRNLSCYRIVSDICSGLEKDTHCHLLLDERISADVLRNEQSTLGGKRLMGDIIHSYGHIAQQLLVPDFEDGSKLCIDYRREDGKVLQGITVDTPESVHLVILGMSGMGMVLAETAAQICHYPNFSKGHRKTKISFIDADIREGMNRFIASHENLFALSHYDFVQYGQGGVSSKHHSPDASYGDFLDVEWEFIDADCNSSEIREMVRQLSEDKSVSLSIAVCHDDAEKTVFTALHLPKEVYASETPVFAYRTEYDRVIAQACVCGGYDSLRQFGAPEQADPLYIRSVAYGKRVNFVYDSLIVDRSLRHKDEDDAWYAQSEVNKWMSIKFADFIPVRLRSFSVQAQDCETLGKSLANMSAKEHVLMDEVEHRRWMMSALMLGFRAETISGRKDWLKIEDKGTAEEIKARKRKEGIHMDIMPYDKLPLWEKNKNDKIIGNIPYIIYGSGFVSDL